VTVEGRSGAVDFAYLEGFAAGDMGVVLEVLALFRRQAEGWAKTLTADRPDWREVLHTIKGASRGVGANALGDICARAEWKGVDELPAVRAALEATVAEIAAYQAANRT
jgi:hypothetical protein